MMTRSNPIIISFSRVGGTILPACTGVALFIAIPAQARTSAVEEARIAGCIRRAAWKQALARKDALGSARSGRRMDRRRDAKHERQP